LTICELVNINNHKFTLSGTNNGMLRSAMNMKRRLALTAFVVLLITLFVFPVAANAQNTYYVDDEYNVQKMIIPMAGMDIVMVACTEKFAKSNLEAAELVSNQREDQCVQPGQYWVCATGKWCALRMAHRYARQDGRAGETRSRA